MKSLIAIFCLAAISLSIRAYSAPLMNERVEPHGELKQKMASAPEGLQVINRISKATINIGGARGNCSGVFISKYGHLVTALHCLQDIFEEVNGEGFLIGTPVKSGAILKSNGQFEGHQIKISPLIMGKDFDVNTEVAVKVTLVGKAFPLKSPDASSSNEVFEVYRNLMEDFAIIKFEELPPAARCVKVAQPDQIVSFKFQKVWHTGFPTVQTLQALHYKNEEFNRKLESESKLGTPWAMDAVSPQYISSGRLFDNYNELLSAIPEIGGRPDISNKILDESIYLVSSAPILGGFSGGGVFSEDGLLIGVNSMMGLSDPTKYEASGMPDKTVIRGARDFGYGVSIVSMGHIIKKAFETKGRQAAEEMFSCD